MVHKARTEKRRVPWLIVVLACLAVLSVAGGAAFLAARGRGRAPSSVALSAEDGTGEAPRNAPAHVAAASSPPLVGARAATPDERERRRTEVQRRARGMLDGVRLQLLNQVQVNDTMNIETIGMGMAPFLQGMVAALQAVDPELMGALRESVADRACDHAQTDIERMFVARVGLASRELASTRAIDCALRDRPQEDVVLWTLLDSWRQVPGRELTPALAALRDAASDERTKRRFLSDAEATAQRKAGHEQALVMENTNQNQKEDENVTASH
jgi:hypothetical protein